jgi:type I protein arginine methyltransferase
VLHAEQVAKVAFWATTDFYGLDLTCLAETAAKDHFSQPVVGYVDPGSLIATAPASLGIDFSRDAPESLHRLTLPFEFTVTRTTLCHGLAAWFDVLFDGADVRFPLSTSPHAPGTHWYQCRLLLREPIAVNAGQRIRGELRMVANARYSYDLELHMELAGSEATTGDGRPIGSEVALRLQDQMYHYLNTATPAAGGAGST